MNEDDFFNSPRQEKEKSLIENVKTSNFNDENTLKKESSSKIVIEAKIPSVTVLADSIQSEGSDESDSENDEKAQNQFAHSTLRSIDTNEAIVKRPDSNNSKDINKSLLDNQRKLAIQRSDSETSDVTNVSPLPTPRNKKISKTPNKSKKNNENSIKNTSNRNIAQEHEFKQILGKILVNGNGTVSMSNTIKNYSFSNDKLKAIDRENQRLLEKINSFTLESKKKRQSLNSSHHNSKSSMKTGSSNFSRPSSATINRKMQQQRIEEENMAMLRRLQQVKPSKEIQALQASRPTSSLSGRSSSMSTIKSPKRGNSLKSDSLSSFRSDHYEPTTICSLLD